MQTFNFDCHGHNAPAYGCNKPGDNSGEYVKHDDAKKLVADLARVIDDLVEIVKNYHEGEACDHAVGICYCGEYSVLDHADVVRESARAI